MVQAPIGRLRKYLTALVLVIASAVLAFLLAIPAVAPRARPQAEKLENVDDVISSEMAAQHIPGLALSVMRDGAVIKAQGYGRANVELDVPVKPETIFQTGSVGKQFTATAVMMLIEEGKLNLDDPISKYLPGTPAGWSAIRVRHLLSHTSGVPDYETDSLKKGQEAFIICARITPKTNCCTNSKRCRSSSRPAKSTATATPATSFSAFSFTK